ncbi:CBS domain-containing protein [Acidiplasma sp.]|jgi:CBS domain-containing protein|uniref:CBS domain-containing protein n=1 Tax=Acidiplasma sp. TaxID=1872114 RepID=UPI00259069EF|nr:CBS domain-containing protein [Acidiplasma sp.]
MQVEELMTRDLVTIEKDATVSEAISKMNTNDIQQLPIVDNKKYVAMLTYKNILRRGSIKTNSKVYNFSINTPVVGEKADVIEAVRLIKESGLNSIPVVEKGILKGIITRTDIIKNLEKIISNAKNIKNFEIMNSDVVTVEENEDIEVAADKIRQLDEYEIPVTKNGRLTGILRAREIINYAVMDKEKISYGEYTSGKSKVEVVASSLMDSPVYVDEDSNVLDTVNVLLKNGLHIVPVVDKNMKVTGIIGISDIINIIETGSEEGFFIEVSGLDQDDRDLYDITYFMADKFIKNVCRIIGNTGKLIFNIRKYKTEGRGKYSVRTKLITPKMTMERDDADYNYGKCISRILKNYESTIKEK